MDYADVLSQVEQFVKVQGKYILDHMDKLQIAKYHDGGADLSTNLDQEVEQNFAEFFKQNFPQTGFLGEENSNLIQQADLNWYVDPIDGTKFFAQGIPLWCISLALVDKNQDIKLGIIYNPLTNKLYKAAQNYGAFVNDQEIAVNQISELNKSQVAFDYIKLEIEDQNFSSSSFHHKIQQDLLRLWNQAYRVRILGSGPLSLVWMAQGFFSAYISPGRLQSKFIDIAAGIIIAKEAGATIFMQNTSEIQHVVAATPQVYTQIMQILALTKP